MFLYHDPRSTIPVDTVQKHVICLLVSRYRNPCDIYMIRCYSFKGRIGTCFCFIDSQRRMRVDKKQRMRVVASKVIWFMLMTYEAFVLMRCNGNCKTDAYVTERLKYVTERLKKTIGERPWQIVPPSLRHIHVKINRTIFVLTSHIRLTPISRSLYFLSFSVSLF